MGNHCGRRPAAEHNRHPGRERLLESLLGKTDSAVSAPCCFQVVLLESDEVIERHDKRKLLLQQSLHARIIKFEEMIGSIDARCQATVHSFAAIRVASDLQSQSMSFVNDRLDFLERQ